MLNEDRSIVTEHQNTASCPEYRFYTHYNYSDYVPIQAELPIRPEFREILPEWSCRGKLVLPSTTGLEAMPFEDKVRFLYSMNTFLGVSFRPMGQDIPTKTYVHSALDNPTIDVDSIPDYERAALLRAQQLFLEPEAFSPESFAELRRVAKQSFFAQKFYEYDYFMDPAGLKDMVHGSNWLSNREGVDRLSPVLKYMYRENLGLRSMWRAIQTTAWSDLWRFWWIDLVSTLADHIFIRFYERYYRDTIWGRFSPAYHRQNVNATDQTATAGGCGMSSGLDPMREDPGNYVLDLDVHMSVLAKVSDYATALNLAYFAGTIPALSEWWYSGSILLDKTALSASIAVLFAWLFSLVAVVILPSSIVRTPVQYAAAFELIGLCVASLFALFGLLWYDPIGQIIALLSIIISSCEFIVLLSQSIGSVRRAGHPVLSVAILWGLGLSVDNTAVSSTWFSLVSAASFVSGYTAYTVGLCAPLVVTVGVPAIGSVLFLSVLWENYLYATAVNGTFPVYGERYAYEPYPLANSGSDKVHERVAALARMRHAFENVVGDIDSIAQSVALVTKYDTIPVTGTDTAAPYGIFIPIIFGAFAFMLVVFVSLLVVFSSKIRWVDLRDAATQYECGSEQTAARVTPLTALSFFRLLLIFWIFELEVTVWFLAFPLITLLSFYSIVVITLFILFVQLAALIEVKSGAIRWLRSVPLFFAVAPGSSAGDGAVWFVYISTFEFRSLFAGLFVFGVLSAVCYARDSAVPRVAGSAVAGAVAFLPILLAVPLKQPDVFYFWASDLELDRKLAARVLAVIDSPSWGKSDLAGRKAKIRPLMTSIVAGAMSGKVGFWSAYVELIFSAQTVTQLDGIVTLLRYHINANLSSLGDFKSRIESKTHFCFTVASKSPATKESFERCVQASMDIMYDKSVSVAGKPQLNFSGGIPDPLRQAWYRALDECVGAKFEVRPRKCRMAAAVRSEFLFFSEAASPQSVS